MTKNKLKLNPLIAIDALIAQAARMEQDMKDVQKFLRELKPRVDKNVREGRKVRKRVRKLLPEP